MIDGWWVSPTPQISDAEIDAFSLSLSAISTISTVAAASVAGLSILVALFALIGWAVVVRNARAKASTVAESKFKNYIGSPEFNKLVDQKIAARVKDRQRILRVTQDQGIDDADPFPPPKQRPTEG